MYYTNLIYKGQGFFDQFFSWMSLISPKVTIVVVPYFVPYFVEIWTFSAVCGQMVVMGQATPCLREFARQIKTGVFGGVFLGNEKDYSLYI